MSFENQTSLESIWGWLEK